MRSRPPGADRLTEAAERAAADWGLRVSELTLVSLAENAVFRIDTLDGERLVLRLHRPGYNTRVEMDSELLWVEALREVGVDAPAARRNGVGAGYVEVEVACDGGSIERRLAGVIEWIDGTDLGTLLEEDPSGVAGRYAAVGALLARIRAHGLAWDPPPGFQRRRWDAAGLVGPDPLWGRFWEVPTDAGCRRLLESARVALFDELSALDTGPEDFGLIHADLHQRNVMVDGDRMVVIDFDDAGFGWYVHELAMALHSVGFEPWHTEARTALIDGYRRVHPLPEAELALLPTFLTIRDLMLVSWLDARPEVALAAHLPHFVDRASTAAERYLAER